jgi:hypothetical protein
MLATRVSPGVMAWSSSVRPTPTAAFCAETIDITDGCISPNSTVSNPVRIRKLASDQFMQRL